MDGEVRRRTVKTVSLWRAVSEAGHGVVVLPSGGKDPDRFFNRTSTSHWRYVRQALLEEGLPEHVCHSGLEALHTVDEALMALDYVRAHDVRSLLVITSAFHAPRARHLFQVAFAVADLGVQPLVLGVPSACEGEALRAYQAKEAGDPEADSMENAARATAKAKANTQAEINRQRARRARAMLLIPQEPLNEFSHASSRCMRPLKAHPEVKALEDGRRSFLQTDVRFSEA